VDEVLQRLETLQQQLGSGASGRAAPASVRTSPVTYSVQEEPAQLPRRQAPQAQAEPLQPQGHHAAPEAGSFLEFIRQSYLPLAAQLEHGHISLRGENELVIEMPANSFYLENIKEQETQKKIRELGEKYFNRALKLTIAAGARGAAATQDDAIDQEHKKKRQEALRNPLVQKIIDVFDGEIVDVKTQE